MCDPTFKRLTTERPAKPVRPLTVRQAIKQGLRLRPHVEHVYTCPADCDEQGSHKHLCMCGDVLRPFHGARGTTIRVPVSATTN